VGRPGKTSLVISWSQPGASAKLIKTETSHLPEVSWMLVPRTGCAGGHLQHAYDRETFDVRGRAAEILAAIGPEKLRVVALFRASRWFEASMANYENDQRLAGVNWVRAAEWWRIGWELVDESRLSH
jgi:hypothetical protein